MYAQINLDVFTPAMQVVKKYNPDAKFYDLKVTPDNVQYPAKLLVGFLENSGENALSERNELSEIAVEVGKEVYTFTYFNEGLKTCLALSLV